MNNIQTQEFIQEKFAEYYKQNASVAQPLPSIEKREFAFLLFKERTMLRHKGFKSVEDLNGFLNNVAPSDAYYSSAYYERPAEEMSAKGWVGADLIFDIDADHIPTPCDKQHDTWTCKNCGASGRQTKPKKCPKCQGQKFDNVTWPCDICLESAKKETIKLMEVLAEDFGFSPKEMNLAFSGHRGYHVQISNDVIKTFDSIMRKEIIDYISGIGLEPKLHSFDLENGVGPLLEDFGWRGRIAKGTYELLLSPEQLESVGLSPTALKGIQQQKQRILERWEGKGPWGLVSGVGPGGWEKIIRKAIETQSVKVDTVVTTDIHRLIRLPNTLHGETGFKKIELPPNEIERFDPFRNAVAFREGTITVEVSDSPSFRVGDSVFGPFRNQRVELPSAAAMFLLCKGAAKVAEETTGVR